MYVPNPFTKTDLLDFLSSSGSKALAKTILITIYNIAARNMFNTAVCTIFTVWDMYADRYPITIANKNLSQYTLSSGFSYHHLKEVVMGWN